MKIVEINVGQYVNYIGEPELLFSFFSTVAHHLEKRRWGERFPAIMKDLYVGELPYEKADQALKELQTIRTELERYTPSEVIWDFYDLSKQPPWGEEISSDITSLANYHVTVLGDVLIPVIESKLRAAAKRKMNVTLEAIDPRAITTVVIT